MTTRFEMTAQQRRDGVRATLNELRWDRKAAAILLLEHSDGDWFGHNGFVEHLLVEGPVQGQVSIDFVRLGKMLPRELVRGGWVDELGSTASLVLWLAAQLVAGDLRELASRADSSTSSLVLRTLTAAFDRNGTDTDSEHAARS